MMKEMTWCLPLAALLVLPAVASDLAAQGGHGTHASGPVPVCDSIDRRAPQRGCTTEQYLLSLLHRFGVEVAMSALDSLAAIDSEVRRDGHGYAHAIGISAYTGAEEVGLVFSRCTPAFQSGCYHGVIQSYFAAQTEQQRGGLNASFVNALCREQRTPDLRWMLFQCAHGMGHGLMMTTDYHLPSALAGCDLVEDAWERESCYGGVFMENIVHATVPHHAVGRPQADHGAAPPGSGQHADHGSAPHDRPAMDMITDASPPAGHAAHAMPADSGAHADHSAHVPAAAADQDHADHPASADSPPAMDHAGHTDHDGHAQATAVEPFPPLNASDPLYPCNVLPERYLYSCYQMQTSAILFHNGYDVAATGRICDTAPEVLRQTCFQSLGRDISSLTSQDHARAMRLCSTAPTEMEPFCHVGYVKNLIDLSAEPADGFAYCRLLPPGESKRVCNVAVGEEIWVLAEALERREEMCRAAEAGYLSACREGAGLDAAQQDASAAGARAARE